MFTLLFRLKDLSVSRTSFSWGIPVPQGFDPRHVMYVWFDALSNYLTGVNALDRDHPLSRYWPASQHIIGKVSNRFSNTAKFEIFENF